MTKPKTQRKRDFARDKSRKTTTSLKGHTVYADGHAGLQAQAKNCGINPPPVVVNGRKIPKGKIVNPRTGRLVDEKGTIGFSILAAQCKTPLTTIENIVTAPLDYLASLITTTPVKKSPPPLPPRPSPKKETVQAPPIPPRPPMEKPETIISRWNLARYLATNLDSSNEIAKMFLIAKDQESARYLTIVANEAQRQSLLLNVGNVVENVFGNTAVNYSCFWMVNNESAGLYYNNSFYYLVEENGESRFYNYVSDVELGNSSVADLKRYNPLTIDDFRTFDKYNISPPTVPIINDDAKVTQIDKKTDILTNEMVKIDETTAGSAVILASHSREPTFVIIKGQIQADIVKNEVNNKVSSMLDWVALGSRKFSVCYNAGNDKLGLTLAGGGHVTILEDSEKYDKFIVTDDSDIKTEIRNLREYLVQHNTLTYEDVYRIYVS